MKSIQGIVTSLKTQNTAKVSVERKWAHPLYGKSVRRNTGYACHYEGIELSEGDTVVIEACVPVSKTKKFRVVNKVEKVEK